MNRIVSSLPGRARLRDTALRRSAQLGELCAVLCDHDGVLGVESNRRAGSVIVRYDVTQVSPDQIEAHIETVATRVLDRMAGAATAPSPDRETISTRGRKPVAAHPAPASTAAQGVSATSAQAPRPAAAETLAGARGGRHGGTLRVRVNRVARRAMLVSLAASLLLAAAGRKRAHTLAGVVFLKFLVMHLWGHRHHLVR